MKRFQCLALYVTLFAVALMTAAPSLACPVSVGSFAVAQPAFVAAPPAVYQSSIGVQCGQQLAVAQPQAVYAAPAVVATPFVLPSYSFASPFVSSGIYGASFVGAPLFVDRFGVAHRQRFFDGRIRERQAARANARVNVRVRR